MMNLTEIYTLNERLQHVQTLGREIDSKFGFSGAGIHRAMGPGPCSDLTRVWDGVGQWQK